jgi:hypothetical protein
MNLYEKPFGVETRWFSPENPTGEPGKGGLTNRGAKGRPFIRLAAGESATLMDVRTSGLVTRIWMTIDDRSPEMLRGLRIDMFWDDAERPAVSAPLGDFFGIGLGRRTPFECALFSDPEGRSFNCFVPMPFRVAARIVVTNESGRDLKWLFYDVDALTNVPHAEDALYFHAHWRRESPNALGQEYAILPPVVGSGRFLGTNLGVVADPRYESAWWGEGEVKVRFDGEDGVTLCGTGTEDYIGTAWGQGAYCHRTQGCSIDDPERGHWAFYRYHLEDPVYFDRGCAVSIQTIGGAAKDKVIDLLARGVPLIPAALDAGGPEGMIPLMTDGAPVDLRATLPEAAGCNFWRQDDWSSVAYFYLDRPETDLPPLLSVEYRSAAL